MSDDLDRLLRGAGPLPPPPMGGALEAELADLRPAPTRRPRRDLARVTAISLAYGAVVLAIVTTRRDLDSISTAWLVAFGVAWLAGFAGLGYLALVPRAGAVLPRSRLAGAAAVFVAIGFVVAGLVMVPSGGPDSVHLGLDRFWRGHWCLETGLATALVPVVLGALALRGALPVGARWTAAALGAAGGSLGGLVLHLHCPIIDRWHLGLLHGGVVVLAALLAAALAPRLAERT